MNAALEIVLWLLLVQGALGAFDVFYNHEWDAKLPSQRSAILELRIHSLRSVLYAIVFAGLAWFKWIGAMAIVFLALIVIEIGLTLWDFVVEDRTRRLSPHERITHTILAMNGGAYVAFLVYVIFTDWLGRTTALEPADYGWISFVMSAYTLGVLLSGIRDGFAARRLARA